MPDGTFQYLAKPGPFKRRSYADNQALAIPKVGVRLKDPAGIKRYKRPVCELCGFAPFDPTRIHGHHLITRAAGGSDEVSTNIVYVCIPCHRDIHDGHVEKSRLEKIISARLGVAIVIDELNVNPPQKTIRLPGTPARLETSECCSCGDLFEGEAGEFYCVECRGKHERR
ncbi:MAG TPA: HNH endonuclease [Tepidisphaeraceae bacterium]|jgi:hypothetical protein|nr:HNH endonuclease [Tepidisphaeraceae bacterium]